MLVSLGKVKINKLRSTMIIHVEFFIYVCTRNGFLHSKNTCTAHLVNKCPYDKV